MNNDWYLNPPDEPDDEEGPNAEELEWEKGDWLYDKMIDDEMEDYED